MVLIALRTLWSHKRRVVGISVSIVLGVSFLTASLVLGDTMRAGFDELFTEANEETAVVVRRSGGLTGLDGVSGDGTVPVALADAVRSVPGVDAVVGHVDGTAQIVGADGTPLGGDGPPTLAGNWIDDERLSPWTLAEGRAPVSADEVVIDRASAQRGSLEVAATTTVRTPRPVEVTVVGIATFGDADAQGPTTHVLFATDVAQELFLADSTSVSSLRVASQDGVDDDALAERIAATLPADMETLTGAELADEQLADLESDFIAIFEMLLLVFAGVGLLVATFSIHNTLSILVAQQARTSALLRAIGATRAQVVTATVVESAAVGLVASVIGFAAGLGLAVAGLAGLDAIGASVPGGLSWSATTMAVAVSVGVVATLVASVVPILSTSRVAPLAAVRELAVESVDVARRRTLIGSGIGTISVLLLLARPGSDAAALGWGTAGLVIATVMVSPRLIRPLAHAIGSPIVRLRGRSGALAVRNAVRNPRRTAGTASALMIGVAVVTGFTVLASSASASIDRMVDRSFSGDLTIYDQEFSGPGLPTSLASELAARPEISTAVGLGDAVVEIDGDTLDPTVTDPAALAALFDPAVSAGDLADVGDSSAAVSDAFARGRDLSVGDPMTFRFPDGSSTTVTVAATYRETDPLGDVIVSRTLWETNGGLSGDRLVLIGLAPGVDLEAGRAAATVVTDRVGAPPPLDGDELVDTVSEEIDQSLMLVYLLLGIAIVIAVLGIGNTISLAIHERTRELGLLRAVGLTRPQLRSMVRWESAIIALIGTGLGLVLGTGISWAAVSAISADGSTVLPMTVPATAVVAIAVLGAAAGVMAGWRPAARAARADILTAIATD